MSPAADSAGQPFEGRSFQSNPFQADTGEADTALQTALDAFSQARTSSSPQDVEEAFSRVVEAFSAARLLIPLIAEAGDFGLTPEGAIVEKSQELSVVHVEGPDGRAVAPVFSSVEAMSRWNSSARPVPVEAARAALATAADGLALMVLDPGSPHTLTFRRGVLQAVARSESYVSPLEDDQVHSALSRAMDTHRDTVVSWEVRSGDPSRTLSGPEVVVVLTLIPGLREEELGSLLQEISGTWSEDAVLAARVDGLGMKILQA